MSSSGSNHQGAFCWESSPALSYATPRTQSQSTPTYAPPFKQLSTLLQSQTYTTWASIASPTDSAAEYGNVAWSSMWDAFPNITALPYTTTVSPTSVPSSELIKPTPLPFQAPFSTTNSQRLPEGFLWGFAGAALQVEGAVKSEGRGPTVMEQTILAAGGLFPDISTLNYYLYKQDIARLAAAGVQSYSFSISWTRILPFGVPGSPINQQGIDHYNDLINTVINYGMTPVVTLVHFDVPLAYAGNNSVFGYGHPGFGEAFVNYAKIAVTHFADRVGHWITFNEPDADGYATSNYASAYTILKAHAEVVHWYRSSVKGTAKWSMKLETALGFGVPLDPSNPDDIAATNRYLDFQIGYFANPLYLGLPVPTSLTQTLGSKAPNFTADELKRIHGTADFFGIDYYGASYITSPPGGIDACVEDPTNAAYPMCIISVTNRDGWAIGYQGNSFPRISYQYVRTFLSYLWQTYNPSGGIIITEFGFNTPGAATIDLQAQRENLPQSIFYMSFLNEMLKAIHEDGVKVVGAIGWAFVDNWEWGEYNDRYGVQTFNMTTLEKTYKRTIFDYVDWMVSHGA